jgi:hypothetical protein
MGSFDLRIPIQCPGCKRKIEIPARTSAPGKVIRCRCGAEITLKGDDLRKTQKAMDDLVATLKRFGR